MKVIKIAIFTALLIAGIGFSASHAKDVFKGADFLGWPEASQILFLDSAVLMAGAIAAQNTDNQGRCIYNWYFNDNTDDVRRKIIVSMKKYPDYPPSGVIIARMQKACGKLGY